MIDGEWLKQLDEFLHGDYNNEKGGNMSNTFYGADVSSWQGSINWAAFNPGAAFVFIKAGRGDDGLYVDSQFNTTEYGIITNVAYSGGYTNLGDGTVSGTTTGISGFTQGSGGLVSGALSNYNGFDGYNAVTTGMPYVWYQVSAMHNIFV